MLFVFFCCFGFLLFLFRERFFPDVGFVESFFLSGFVAVSFCLVVGIWVGLVWFSVFAGWVGMPSFLCVTGGVSFGAAWLFGLGWVDCSCVGMGSELAIFVWS